MGAGREFEAKTLQEALRAAASAVGRPPDQLDYEVLAEGRRGVFGLGHRHVRIWVELPEGAELPAAALDPAIPGAPHADDVAWVEETILSIVRLMALNLTVQVDPFSGGVRAELSGPDRQVLIARDAEVLVALGFLVGRIAHHRRPGAGRVQIDCKGYHGQRERDIVARTRAAAREVAETGATRSFEEMNPYERRLIHLTIQERPGLSTRSVGDGFLKRVEIFLAAPRGEA